MIWGGSERKPPDLPYRTSKTDAKYSSEGLFAIESESPVEEEKGVVCRYFISRGLVVRASNEDGMKIGI